ncbi:5224_t:CDS:2 [Funneliformis geosporum]|uniref:5224_t:CDS:1 n=1 Tax=Funneliformis geosporum TaxID=1117311 RepID=A0A9W4SYL6_9GLOM|nr:5224_t:CDS:2 [Funneliformis geosporum]
MEENKRKAMNEKDPLKKQKILEEIESDGKLLQQKYQEHQEHSNKFRFDPSKHVSDIIDRIKKAIEKSLNKPRGDGSDPDKPGRPNKPNKPDGNDPFGGDGYGSLPDGSSSNRIPRPRKPSQSENNQQLIIIVAVATKIKPRNPAVTQAKKAKKQKQATLLIALALIGGLAYYFFGYLPEERTKAKEEITEMFRDNWNVTADKLDKTL